MAERITVEAQTRTARGKRAVRHLRRDGWVPATLYGHGEEPLAIQARDAVVAAVLKSHARLVTMKVGDQEQPALIREIQVDPVEQSVLHLDFHRVDITERVRVKIRIDLRGTPVGVTSGGSLVHLKHEIEAECPVISIPESIRVSVESLAIGQMLYVKDIPLPEGVALKEDPEQIAVMVSEAELVPETPVAATPGAEEPEVIVKREPKAEEGEEEAGKA